MTSRLHNALRRAWIMAEDYNEGKIVVQYLKDGTYLVTHQIGNSWPNLGYGGAYESEDRIVAEFDCRYYDKLYWEDEKEIEKNRLAPEEYEDKGGFYDILEETEKAVKELKA